MAKKGFTYAGTASQCPGALNTQTGWYSGTTLIAATYTNPATGLAYTAQELGAIGGGTTTGGGGATAGGTTTTPSATPTTTATGGDINPYTGKPFTTADLSGMGVATTQDFWNFYNQGLIQDGQYVGEAGVAGTGGWGDNPPTDYNVPGAGATTPAPVTMPTFDPNAISPATVTPAPPFEKTEAQIAFEEMYSGKLTDWVTDPQGIPPETQAQMIQKQTDALKARETESIRVMRNNMERRNITNSGYVEANVQNIKSNTTIAIAGAIADVQIKSELMKLASFEKAMGAAAQFLGYLSEQSQLQYQPQFATWQTQQMAKMQAWQASFDKYKMELNQAYQTQNINLQGYWNELLQNDQQAADYEMFEIKLEAEKQAAMYTGAGQFFTGLISLAAASI